MVGITKHIKFPNTLCRHRTYSTDKHISRRETPQEERDKHKNGGKGFKFAPN